MGLLLGIEPAVEFIEVDNNLAAKANDRLVQPVARDGVAGAVQPFAGLEDQVTQRALEKTLYPGRLGISLTVAKRRPSLMKCDLCMLLSPVVIAREQLFNIAGYCRHSLQRRRGG